MANRIRGITVEINGDTTKLTKALQGVDKNIRNTQSQLKDVEKLLKLDPTNTELLSQKQRLLGEAVKDTKERLDTLKTASEKAAQTAGNYDAWKAKYDPIKTKITETEEKLKELKKESEAADKQLAEGKISQEKYDSLQQEINETETQLKKLKDSAKAVDDEFGKPISPEQYDALQREIIETEQDLQRLQTEANNANVALSKIGAIGGQMQEVGNKISGVGQSLLPVTGAIAAVGTAAVKTGADFDSAMSQVAAVSGATGEDFDALRAKAREMGSQTKFSASEAAEAMNYMAMAGWKTDDMLDGVAGIMNLAAASGEELATTSDIVTDALTALGMTADESAHFADILAAASSNANTNVSLLGESFKYCAPVAGSMGASAEDLSIALGLMANSGIKGSQAGNSLKNALVNLVKPTEQQANAMKALGLITTETVNVIDSDKVEKAQTKVANKTLDLEKAQISYNDAVTKYGAASSQAQKALLNVEKAENNLTAAQKELTTAQQGTFEVVETGQNAFTDEYGNMKSLGEIMEVLRSNLGAVNVELVDSEGNMREYDDIIAELEQTEEGLTQAEQLKNAAIIFGKQNLSGMLAIINASEKDYNDLTEAIYGCEGTAQNMADTMQDNLAGQLTILKSQLEELAISFADILMPAIRNIVSKIQSLVDKLNGMSEGTRKAIIVAALVAASIGPILIVVGKLITSIGTLMIVISKAPAILSKMKAGFAAVKAAIAGVSAPVVAVVAIIAVLVAAFKHLWDTNEEFRNAILNIWNGIVSKFQAFFQAITDRLNALGFDFTSIVDVIKAVWDGLCAMLAPVFEGAFQIIADTLSFVLDVILGIVDVFIGLFTGDWEQAWNGIKSIFQSAWDFICNLLGSVVNILTGIWDTFLGFFGTSWDEVWTAIKDFFVGIWDSIQETMYGFFDAFVTGWNAIKNFFTNILNAIKTVVSTIWNAIYAYYSTIFKAIYTVISTVINTIKNVIITVWTAIYNTIKPLLDAFQYLFKTIFEAVKILIGRALDWMSGKIQAIWNAIVTFITPILEGIRNTFETIWNAISTVISTVMGAVQNVIMTVWNTVSGFISSVLSAIASVVSSVWNNIKMAISDVLNAIKTTVTNIWNAIKTTISNVLNTIKTTVSTIWDNIKSAVSNKVTGIKNTIVEGFNNAVSFIKGLAGQAWQWGADIIGNIVNGIRSMIGNVASAVTSVADTIRNFLHFSVPDKGPLTDFESWMPDFMKGLAQGIRKNQKYVEKAVSGVAEAMKLTVTSDLKYTLDGISAATMTGTPTGTVINNYNNDNSRTVNQTNNSPKSLSRLEIYRQTRNALNIK